MYSVKVEADFSSAHNLRGYKGKCEGLHGHNWIIEAYIQCRKLNKLGIGIDFRDVKGVLKDVLGKLDHTNLNDIAEFGAINPTSENLSKFLFIELSLRLNTEFTKVKKIMVFESPGCGSAYWEE